MIFDGPDESIYYSPNADRLFIFKRATFLQLPCLEREDGAKMILNYPEEIIKLCGLGLANRYKLIYIGEI